MHATITAGCAAVGLGAVLTASASPPLTLLTLLALLCLGALHHEHHLTHPGPRQRPNTTATGPGGPNGPTALQPPPAVLAAVLLLPTPHVIATITLLHLYQRARPTHDQTRPHARYPASRATDGSAPRWARWRAAWWPLVEITTTALAALAAHTALTHTPPVQPGDPVRGVYEVLAATGGYLTIAALTTTLTTSAITVHNTGARPRRTPQRVGQRWTRWRGLLNPLVTHYALAALLAVTLATAPPLIALVLPLIWLSQRAARDAHLAHTATHDDKTGLLTTATWRAIATAALARRGATTGVIIVDLDHFKHINDNHGHLVGDHVLALVADTLTRCVRTGDSIARYGGDEFLILLPDTTATDTTTVAERIRHTATGIHLPDAHSANRGGGQVTVSIGIAHHAPDNRDEDDQATAPDPIAALDPTADLDPDTALGLLLRTADHALYQSKHSGRNTITSGPTPPAPTTSASDA